ncbi:PAS fold [Formivibrio citricus]|uniref:PAS fold n=1 Tax=Formivibrio citricus TaxID=83765 RepID=A0A1I4X9W5_9NEIS|nr:PAS-domain containing protein [Formivibrio citricus]SFN22684.1 PAS fold [Formivibrio citricus]
MFGSQRGKTQKLLILAAMALTAWVALSWLFVSSFSRERIGKLVREELEVLNKQTDSLARDTDASLGFLLGVSELVARDERVIGLLSDVSVPAMRRQGARGERLAEINRYLANLSASLSADVVWITAATGDCVAASNAHLPESFIGTNYADRDYFQEARLGKTGQQYAMGRKTNIPGMFFSVPVMVKGRFVGTVTSKIDLPKLAHLVRHADAFVSDENGVVILANDKTMEMRTLPNAPVAHTTEAVRMARYKKMDFPGLDIAPWGSAEFPVLRRFGTETSPFLFSKRVLEGKDLEVHSYRRLPQIEVLNMEKRWLFSLLLATGLLLVAGFVWKFYHKHAKTRRVESALLFRSVMESTADGILIVDGNQRIAAFNQRFMEMWSVPPGLLAAGQTDALITHVMGRAELSLESLSLLSDVLANPRACGRETVQIKDGRIIECDAQAQMLEECVIGRVWRFRDVTAQIESPTQEGNRQDC